MAIVDQVIFVLTLFAALGCGRINGDKPITLTVHPFAGNVGAGNTNPD